MLLGMIGLQPGFSPNLIFPCFICQKSPDSFPSLCFPESTVTKRVFCFCCSRQFSFVVPPVICVRLGSWLYDIDLTM